MNVPENERDNEERIIVKVIMAEFSHIYLKHQSTV